MAAARVRHRVGVTGYPLTHTVSPAFQQPAFDHYGISAAYRTYPVTAEDLPALIATLREPEWLGLNVTIPTQRSSRRPRRPLYRYGPDHRRSQHAVQGWREPHWR